MNTHLAQIIENPVGPAFSSGRNYVSEIIPAFIRFGLIVGVLVFFFVLITGAIQWMTAGGDKASIETARGKITSALIGIIILFTVFVILQVIGNFFGLEALKILELDVDQLKIRQ